jgi:GMP synthase (glutamine-hydrolysing)
MSLRIVVLQHERETGLGAFAALLNEGNAECTVVETLRDPLPDPGAFDGAIALGGSLNADNPRLLEIRRWIRHGVLRGLPFLGVCLGGQLLARALCAAVDRQAQAEVGVHDVYLTEAARRDPLFSSLPGRLAVFGWHEDRFELPPGAVPLAGSIACTYQAFRFGAAYALQFHPEVRAGDARPRQARASAAQPLARPRCRSRHAGRTAATTDGLSPTRRVASRRR